MCVLVRLLVCRYTHTAFSMPSSAMMCDVVRCLIECKDAQDMVDVFKLVCDKMEVRALFDFLLCMSVECDGRRVRE